MSLLARVFALCWLALAALGCQGPSGERPVPTSSPQPSPPDPAARYIVAAHYYTWFEEAFKNGYLRGHLVPPQQPELGQYSGFDPAVPEQHIDWAAEYGIEVLTLDFWPSQSKKDQRHDIFMNAPNISDIQFCIFYETGDLGFDPDTDTLSFDSQKGASLVSDLEWIADKYFSHPSYFRIDGRPVLMLYVTRTFSGDYEQAIREARNRLKARGYDVFLIGDEVYWSCQATGHGVTGGRGAVTEAPQQSRIRLFDAITAYNYYNPDRTGHRGYGADSHFLRDVAALNQRYSEATDGVVPVLPSVIPGYNDRAYRPEKDHFAIPRQWRKGDAEASFLAHMLDDFALPFTDERVPLIFVTSWNEWNEDTSVEPAGVAAATTKDKSGRQAFTQGILYAGFGTAYLEAVRDRCVAISGLVKDGKGRPVSGQPVSAWRGDRLIATDRSDSKGRFQLSRMTVSPGTYSVGLSQETAELVRVAAARTTTGVSLLNIKSAGVSRLSLDLGDPESRHQLVQGFSFDERDGSSTYVWSLGPSSLLTLRLGPPSRETYVLRLRVRGFRAICPVGASLSLNGVELGKISASPKWSIAEVEVPAGVLKSGDNTLQIVYERTGQPSKILKTQDERELAIGFDRVWLEPAAKQRP